MLIKIYERRCKPLIKKGDKFNKLTAIKFSHRNKWGQQYWFFKCDCGNEKIINTGNIKTGHTKSCGCLARELTKKRNSLRDCLRMSKTKIYHIWQSMISRCLNPNNKAYKNYGGRGIKICDKWLKFENFYADMGNRPIGLSLDRIENNGNYCKSNCKWSSPREQCNNTRRNHFLIFGGKTQTIAQWARELGIKYNTISNRIYKGWSVKKALTISPRNN